MLHNDISGHMNNIKMNWTYFINTLTGDKKFANFDTVNWSYIIRGIFSIPNSGEVNSNVAKNSEETLEESVRPKQ